jgi:phosphoglycerate dehydrogenase-like enzyme
MAGRHDGELLYLTTLDLPPSVLRGIESVSPRVTVVQRPCSKASDVPSDIWHRVDVLHTSQVLPDPELVPRLAWIQLDTAGIDHIIDHPLWRSTSVPVTTIGGVSGPWTAEYVVMMMLAFNHGLPDMLARQHERRWPNLAERWSTFVPRHVAGTTCTVVGFGHIGRATGRLCTALGMDVVGVRRHVVSPGAGRRGMPTARSARGRAATTAEVDVTCLPEVLSWSDYVVICLPLTTETTMLFGAEMLGHIKRGAVMVNVSRGGIVDEAALASALHAGHLRGAAFDVFASEPLPASSPLWDAPGMIISPHVAGFAGDYADKVESLVSENLRRFLTGLPLVNQASRETGY